MSDYNQDPIDPIINNAVFHNLTPNAGIRYVVQPFSLRLSRENVMWNVSRDAAYKYKFNVMVWNTGTGTQTFDVKFYYNSSKTWDMNTLAGFTQIGSTITVSNLAEMESRVVQFAWDPAGVRGHWSYSYFLTFLARISGMSVDGGVVDNTKLGFRAWPFPLIVRILMGGDCNGDGRINYQDLNILAPNYGRLVPPGDPRADFNRDGRINYKDLNIMAPVYGKIYS